MQSKAIAIENDLRGNFGNFGLKVEMVGKVKFEARIKELVETLPDSAGAGPTGRRARLVGITSSRPDRRFLPAVVRDDEVCRRLMTTPVLAAVALTYRATVDVPARFRKSKAVGAVFGLTCAKYQSGEVDWDGRISRCGDEMILVTLAPGSLEHDAFEEMVLAQGLGDADRQAPRDEEGNRRTGASVGRATLMHRIWVTAPSSAGPGNKPRPQHENHAGSNPIGGNSSSTERWNNVPRGTMDEVSSHVRLDLPFVRRQGRGIDCSTSFSNPMMEGPWRRFREKHEPERHRHLLVADSLKVIDNVLTRRALQEKAVRLGCTVLHQCIRPRMGAHAPDHHGNPRASDLINGHASKGSWGHQFSGALERPFLHLFCFSRTRWEKDRGLHCVLC